MGMEGTLHFLQSQQRVIEGLSGGLQGVSGWSGSSGCPFRGKFQGKQMHIPTEKTALLPLVVKNPPIDVGDIRGVGSIPGSGRSSG